MEFRVLGPLEVWHDGHEVSPRGPKPRALLAVLLLHANEVVPADRLIDELWGEDSPERRRRRAPGQRLAAAQGAAAGRAGDETAGLRRSASSRTRSISTASSGWSTRAGACSRAACAADASERLRDALALWRGPALADFAYESFAQAAIARLEEIRLAAIELRIDADLALGRHDELIGELEALVAEHPLRERLRSYLMTALYRSGRQAEALEAYQDARRALVDELGIDPSPALQELERAILRHDPSLDAASTCVVPTRSRSARFSSRSPTRAAPTRSSPWPSRSCDTRRA